MELPNDQTHVADTSKTPDSNQAKSKLEQLPIEIRLEIFRYLLLPLDKIYISPQYRSQILPRRDLDGNSRTSRRPDASKQPTIIDTSMVEDSTTDVIFEKEPSAPALTASKNEGSSSRLKILKNDGYSIYPEILRTSKKIHEEASWLLYKEGTAIVGFYDLYNIASIPHYLGGWWNMDFVVKRELELFGGIPRKETWRHSPIRDQGYFSEETGRMHYLSAPNTNGGLMYPHMFAQFQKIHFDGRMKCDICERMDFRTSREIVEYAVYSIAKIMRSSPVIKELVQLLSYSPLIEKFTFDIGIRLDSLTYKEWEYLAGTILLPAVLKILPDFTEQAIVKVLETKVLNPLQKLKNVKEFEIRFIRNLVGNPARLKDRPDFLPTFGKLVSLLPTNREPPTEYIDIVARMKRLIETKSAHEYRLKKLKPARKMAVDPLRRTRSSKS